MSQIKVPSKLTALNFNLRKPTQEKQKILFISDLQISVSGVGVQANILIDGLLKTGKYSFRCLGAADRHGSYEPIAVNGNPDYLIKPIDGFGDHNIIRQLLYTEKPDAIIIFTDPRQFMWLWEIEDEIHEICPIAYWHVWDNDPYPAFNEVWYNSTDLINCLSYKTYEMVKPHFPEKTNYIPHAFPKEIYRQLNDFESAKIRSHFLPGKEDWFVGLWTNRNAHRKMPNDLLTSFKFFLDDLEKTHGHRKALLIMHTDPFDREGPNLPAVIDHLGISNNVWISKDRLNFQDMNNLHNMVDYTISISRAEGFGLSTLISMQCGKPIIANCTGGLTRQVIDYRDGSENGVAIVPAARSLIGSQQVPYIYDDHVNQHDVAKAFMKLFEMGPEKRKEVGERAMAYVEHEFNYDNVIKEWDRTLSETITKFKAEKLTRKNWSLIPLGADRQEMVMPPTQNTKVQHNKPKVK